MSRPRRRQKVCKYQTNIDIWMGMGPEWFQRIMKSPGGKLQSIFEPKEEKVDACRSPDPYDQEIFPGD